MHEAQEENTGKYLQQRPEVYDHHDGRITCQPQVTIEREDARVSAVGSTFRGDIPRVLHDGLRVGPPETAESRRWSEHRKGELRMQLRDLTTYKFTACSISQLVFFSS